MLNKANFEKKGLFLATFRHPPGILYPLSQGKWGYPPLIGGVPPPQESLVWMYTSKLKGGVPPPGGGTPPLYHSDRGGVLQITPKELKGGKKYP